MNAELDLASVFGFGGELEVLSELIERRGRLVFTLRQKSESAMCSSDGWVDGECLRSLIRAVYIGLPASLASGADSRVLSYSAIVIL